MIETNIYTYGLNYRKLIKKSNLYFAQKYNWYNPKTIFAPEKGNYLVSIQKGNIRICYWDEQTPSGIHTRFFLKKYIEANIKNVTIGLKTNDDNDFFSKLESVKIFYL